MTSVQINFPNPHSCQQTEPAGNANFHPELSGPNSRHKDLDHVELPWERFTGQKQGTQPGGRCVFFRDQGVTGEPVWELREVLGIIDLDVPGR